MLLIAMIGKAVNDPKHFMKNSLSPNVSTVDLQNLVYNKVENIIANRDISSETLDVKYINDDSETRKFAIKIYSDSFINLNYVEQRKLMNSIRNLSSLGEQAIKIQLDGVCVKNGENYDVYNLNNLGNIATINGEEMKSTISIEIPKTKTTKTTTSNDVYTKIEEYALQKWTKGNGFVDWTMVEYEYRN